MTVNADLLSCVIIIQWRSIPVLTSRSSAVKNFYFMQSQYLTAIGYGLHYELRCAVGLWAHLKLCTLFFFKWGYEQQQNVWPQWIKWRNHMWMSQKAKFWTMLSIALHMYCLFLFNLIFLYLVFARYAWCCTNIKFIFLI
jgi:hypothetical protein